MRTEIIEKIAKKAGRLSTEEQGKILEFVESFEPSRRTLHDIWLEISKDMPEDAFADIPTDASYNLNHYLYGSPKK